MRQRLPPRGSWQNRQVLTEGVEHPLPTQKAPLPCAESGAFFNLFLPGCGKPGAVLVFLIGGDHDLQPAHVRLQHFGDGHAAVGLQVVLQEGDQHTRGCHAGVVQGVSQIGLAVLALDADVQAARLCIAQVGAGTPGTV